MMPEPLSFVVLVIWLLAAGMYPVGLMLGAPCSKCGCEDDCQSGKKCPKDGTPVCCDTETAVCCGNWDYDKPCCSNVCCQEDLVTFGSERCCPNASDLCLWNFWGPYVSAPPGQNRHQGYITCSSECTCLPPGCNATLEHKKPTTWAPDQSKKPDPCASLIQDSTDAGPAFPFDGDPPGEVTGECSPMRYVGGQSKLWTFVNDLSANKIRGYFALASHLSVNVFVVPVTMLHSFHGRIMNYNGLQEFFGHSAAACAVEIGCEHAKTYIKAYTIYDIQTPGALEQFPDGQETPAGRSHGKLFYLEFPFDCATQKFKTCDGRNVRIRALDEKRPITIKASFSRVTATLSDGTEYEIPQVSSDTNICGLLIENVSNPLAEENLCQYQAEPVHAFFNFGGGVPGAPVIPNGLCGKSEYGDGYYADPILENLLEKIDDHNNPAWEFVFAKTDDSNCAVVACNCNADVCGLIAEIVAYPDGPTIEFGLCRSPPEQENRVESTCTIGGETFFCVYEYDQVAESKDDGTVVNIHRFIFERYAVPPDLSGFPRQRKVADLWCDKFAGPDGKDLWIMDFQDICYKTDPDTGFTSGYIEDRHIGEMQCGPACGRDGSQREKGDPVPLDRPVRVRRVTGFPVNVPSEENFVCDGPLVRLDVKIRQSLSC